jgi:rubredoxin
VANGGDDVADEETTTEAPRDEAEGKETENKRPKDTLAESKKCPECGAPVDDVRATCIDCGYEYKDEDHEDPDAGHDFVSGTQVDDEGNELPDEEPPEESPKDAAENNGGGEEDQ